MVIRRVIGVLLLAALPLRAFADAASDYQAALDLYWQEKNVDAAAGFVQVIDRWPGTAEAGRASYMVTILLKKIGPREAQAMQTRGRVSAATSNLVALATVRQAEPKHFLERVGRFIVDTTNDSAKVMALQLLCDAGWKDGEVPSDPRLCDAVLKEVVRLNFQSCTDTLVRLAHFALQPYRPGKDDEQIERIWHQVFRWRPEMWSARMVLESDLRLGRRDEARRFVGEMRGKISDQDYAAAIFDAYSSQMLLPDAGAMLQEEFKSAPNDAGVLFALARILSAQHRPAEALALLAPLPQDRGDVRDIVRQIEDTLPEKYMPVWVVNDPVWDQQGVESIALGPDDRCYGVFVEKLTNASRHEIVCFDPTSGASSKIAVLDGSHNLNVETIAFAIYPDGTFLVGNSHFGRDGRLIENLPMDLNWRQGSVSGDFTVLGPNGAGTQFTMVRKDGTAESFGEESTNRDQAVKGVIDGNRVVLGWRDGLEFYDLEGHRTASYREPAKRQYKDLADFAIDAEGLIYVAERHDQEIHIFGADMKQPLTSFKAAIFPVASLAVDKEGALYVREQDGLVKYVPRNGGARAMVKKP